MIPEPKYPEGANLLRDKVVVVTAAAGTGIGSAVAKRSLEDVRGRAHDVLWMCSLAARRTEGDRLFFTVFIGHRKHRLHAVMDADGVTIGLPEDF